MRKYVAWQGMERMEAFSTEDDVAGNRSRQSDRQRQQQARARAVERQRNEQVRAAAAALKERERAAAAAEKERRRLYLEAAAAQVERRNAELAETVEGLHLILKRGVKRSSRLNLAAARRAQRVTTLDLGDLADPVPIPAWEEFAPRPPGALARALGGTARHEARVAEAKVSYERAIREAETAEAARQQQVAAARRSHDARSTAAMKAVEAHNAAVDRKVEGLRLRDADVVSGYLAQVLAAVPLPARFPREAEVTYNPKSEQAVVRVELPPRSVVPDVDSYRYLPNKDETRPVPRKVSDLGAIYKDVISQVALLCIRDLFDGDAELREVGFNGHVHATNPATGKDEFPCIISLSVDRETFPQDGELAKVTAEVCVRHQRAIISSHPYELTPVEPILDFDLSKYSFVQGFDAVATLDSRPDLMDMSPTNFEHLVRQLFEAQGAEGWTTTESKDDGVDAVIAKRTPLMGGLSIVQAKRYSRVLGPGHIRELVGAMDEKRAGWGILITTSWFTSGCWEKARQNGRIELIDGDRLVYLIKEHMGKDVLVGIPNRPAPREGP